MLCSYDWSDVRCPECCHLPVLSHPNILFVTMFLAERNKSLYICIWYQTRVTKSLQRNSEASSYLILIFPINGLMGSTWYFREISEKTDKFSLINLGTLIKKLINFKKIKKLVTQKLILLIFSSQILVTDKFSKIQNPSKKKPMF